MNQEELMQLIEDHYLGESQLLTNGTEENLLKLAELRGNMTPEQAERWEQIKTDFKRNKALGGDETDSGNKIANQMIHLVEGLTELKSSISQSSEQSVLLSNERNAEQSKLMKIELKKEAEQAQALLEALNSINESLGTQTIPSPIVEVVNQPSEKIIETLDLLTESMQTSIQPLLLSMEKKMDIDLRTLERIQDLTSRVESLKVTASKTTRKRSTPRKKASSRKKTVENEIETAKPSSDSKRF